MRNKLVTKPNSKILKHKRKFIGAMGLLMVAAITVTACATGQSSYDDSYDRGSNSQPRGSYTEK